MPSAHRSPLNSPFLIAEQGQFLASLSSAILGAVRVQDLVADLHKLNPHERIFVCVDAFLTTTAADGVGHFFYYDCADLLDEVLGGLDAIGASDARTRLGCYVDRVFGGSVPEDMATRQTILEALEVDQDDEIERMVGDPHQVASLLAHWAREHSEHFRLR